MTSIVTNIMERMENGPQNLSLRFQSKGKLHIVLFDMCNGEVWLSLKFEPRIYNGHRCLPI